MFKTIQTLTKLDILLNWRQRTVVITSVLFALILLGFLLISPVNIDSSAPEILRMVSTQTLFSVFPMIHVFSALVLPLFLSDSFARDNHHEVHELLRALPISNIHYLLGKILAIFLTAIVVMGFLSFFVGGLWWFLIYPFDIMTYLQVWLINIIPIAGLNSVLLALFTIGQPTRRRTFYLSLGLVFITIVLMVAFPNPENTLLYYLNPGRPVILNYYIEKLTSDTNTSTIATCLIALSIAFIEVVIIFFLQLWNLNRTK